MTTPRLDTELEDVVNDASYYRDDDLSTAVGRGKQLYRVTRKASVFFGLYIYHVTAIFWATPKRDRGGRTLAGILDGWGLSDGLASYYRSLARAFLTYFEIDDVEPSKMPSRESVATAMDKLADPQNLQYIEDFLRALSDAERRKKSLSPRVQRLLGENLLAANILGVDLTGLQASAVGVAGQFERTLAQIELALAQGRDAKAIRELSASLEFFTAEHAARYDDLSQRFCGVVEQAGPVEEATLPVEVEEV